MIDQVAHLDGYTLTQAKAHTTLRNVDDFASVLAFIFANNGFRSACRAELQAKLGALLLINHAIWERALVQVAAANHFDFEHLGCERDRGPGERSAEG